MVNKALYSSKKHDWQTPDHILEAVRRTYGGIALDPCTSADNPTGASNTFTVADDGLVQDWEWAAWATGCIFVNPPYGREQAAWVRKAASVETCPVVVLIPARPDTKLWQETVFPLADYVVFLRGRLRFKGAEQSAPFPSALVMFNDCFTSSHFFNELGTCLACPPKF